MAYRPGQGLNHDALERLRARKQQTLPAEDDSKQWESLLGEGVKKTRCGVCTRPLLDDEQFRNTFVCTFCDQASRNVSKGGRTNRTRERHAQKRTSLACDTPSTSASSGCQSPRDSEESVDNVLIATITKALSHIWIDTAGKTYTIRHEDCSRWTCTFKQYDLQQIVLLCLDAEAHVIWWKREHFCDISELCSHTDTLDNLCWYSADDVDRRSPSYVWRRHRRNEADSQACKKRMLRMIARGPPPYLPAPCTKQ
mmetsp:Transcript_93769/g.148057  ORF Transcript_93769/g.148057 Transcript_93769/m.148057 type:complete len:254 (-) Transcript_93769:85-846(-)|eukprot:CAMPEP_0169110600 /NCGR_PEP_ID=MMETSP1015-20121227/26602_1 /TAXON_ID=342587 /ORGANISM="Karlodinium micrum, Strain CCMP2283" /LENGTH=253 /DNA_ID=CAMNT_0009172409 /DNA_START=49 /DNA_END=810 /DNA_ORIENTATION=+